MKHYKCGFSHCAHADGKVPENEAVKIGTRYWHRDCYEISETIKDIRETYLDAQVSVMTLRKGMYWLLDSKSWMISYQQLPGELLCRKIS